MLRFLFLLLSFQLFAITGAQAETHDYIIDRAYFEDPTNSLTFAEVQNKPYTPYIGLLSKGFSLSTFWVRLKISPKSNTQVLESKNLILHILPNYLDEIELFDSLSYPHRPRVVGDRHPLKNNEHISLSHSFVVPFAQEPRYLWLRLKTTSTNLMKVQALDIQDSYMFEEVFEVLTYGGFAMFFVFLIWAGLHWLFFQERIVGIFLIRQIVGISLFASYMGLLKVIFSDVLTPIQLDYILSFFVLATSFVSIWFHVELLNDYLIHRRIKYSLYALMALFPIELLLMATDHIVLALKINMLMILLVPIYLLMIVLFAIPWDRLSNTILVLPKKVLLPFYFSYVFITSIAAFPALGFRTMTDMAPYVVLLHGIVTGLMLLVMVTHRSKKMHQNDLLQVVVAKHEAIHQRARREEQGHFLEMLTHEFKTALSVLRFSLARVVMNTSEAKYAEQAIVSMNEVIERCGQVQALEDGQVEINKIELDLVALLKELIQSKQDYHRIQFKAMQNEVMIVSDARLLKIIFANLIDNACKYSKVDSYIHMSLEVSEKHVNVKIINEVGVAGMPDQSMVFKKYYRARKAHQRVGSGLGLYLTDQMARMLNAKLAYVPIDSISSNSKVSFELCIIKSE